MSMQAVPGSARLLGWAGVMPFAALSLMPNLMAPAFGALVAYGALILAFMGGVQWGLEMARPSAADEAWLGYAASVSPALLAFAASQSPTAAALCLLVAGFVGLLLYDLSRTRQGIAPPWYAPLRFELSAAVIVLLAVAAGRAM